jgi:hypothetical protein
VEIAHPSQGLHDLLEKFLGLEYLDTVSGEQCG